MADFNYLVKVGLAWADRPWPIGCPTASMTRGKDRAFRFDREGAEREARAHQNVMDFRAACGEPTVQVEIVEEGTNA